MLPNIYDLLRKGVSKKCKKKHYVIYRMRLTIQIDINLVYGPYKSLSDACGFMKSVKQLLDLL